MSISTAGVVPYRALAIVAASLLAVCAVGSRAKAVPPPGGGPAIRLDPLADAVARRTDPGATLAFDTFTHRLPDLLEIRLVAFFPFDASLDLLEGISDPLATSSDFFRLDLVLDGLANPGGSVDPLSYAPFIYGDNPIYGFVEIDMDEDPNTGGELDAPQFRYMGNAARFGGMVQEKLLQPRVAIDASAFDNNFVTPPQVERSGEEFHLALLGGDFLPGNIEKPVGDGDTWFEAGETWQITSHFFHRAHGFAPFSFMKGGMHPGEYEPETTLQFAHDLATDQTVISLVFPLTQVGAAMVSGTPVQDLNLNPTDQASIEEGLADLVLSAQFLTDFPSGDPEEAIIVGWAPRNVASNIEPDDWDVTALLGSAYTEPDLSGVYYLWSDVYPDIVRGDVDGDDEVRLIDENMIAAYIASNDASDGTLDGAVVIAGFANDFSLFDVNQDGVVTAFDIVASHTDGDVDNDNDVDLADIAAFQRCFQVNSMQEDACVGADLNMNGTVELADMTKLGRKLNGPK